MSPLDLLKLAENISTVAYHRFVLLSKGRENDLFCFFEGKDSNYYGPRIKGQVKRKYHPISCGNKKGVIEIWQLISNKKEYTKYQKCFFIDRDFDPPLNSYDVYETSCYSLENYYVNEESVSEILKNEFQLTEEDEEYKDAMKLFRSELEIYSNGIMLFNGWYAALKYKKTREGLSSTMVNLDDKLPKGFIHLQIGAIKSNYDLTKIREIFHDAIPVTDKEVFDAINEIKKNDVSCSLRGKFQFSFFYTFLRFLIEDANKTQSIIKKKTKFNLDKSNMYSQLSQYAITPVGLLEYLRQFN